MLADYIGKPAALEQTAEECVELAQACLKLARAMRMENPVYTDKNDILNNLAEEMADVLICMDALVDDGIISPESVDSWRMQKFGRLQYRMGKMSSGN